MVKGLLPLAGLRPARLVKSRKPEQPIVRAMNPERLAIGPRPAPLIEPIGGTMPRRFANESLNDCRVSTASTFALMHKVAELLSVAQLFTRPQRADEMSRFKLRPDYEVILRWRDVVVRLVVAGGRLRPRRATRRIRAVISSLYPRSSRPELNRSCWPSGHNHRRTPGRGLRQAPARFV